MNLIVCSEAVASIYIRSVQTGRETTSSQTLSPHALIWVFHKNNLIKRHHFVDYYLFIFQILTTAQLYMYFTLYAFHYPREKVL